MKFTVRTGFVIHDTRIVKQGDKQVEQTNSYYEGDDVDFDEASAAKHLHKLEPADKESTKFCAARHVSVAAPSSAVNGIDPALLPEIIAQAVAAALKAQAAVTADAAAGSPAQSK